MSRILVVEPQAATAVRLEQSLQQLEPDLDVIRVEGVAAALQATSEQETHAVVVGPGVASPFELVGAVSHGRAGGVPVVVISERSASELGLGQVPRLSVVTPDAIGTELAQAVRHGLDSAPVEAARPIDEGPQFTSEQLFGDVLDEVAPTAEETPPPQATESAPQAPAEGGAPPAAPPPTAPPTPTPAAPEKPAPEPAAPGPAATTPPRSRRSQDDDEIEKVLQETLAGTLDSPTGKRRRAASSDSEVDELLGGALAEITGTEPRRRPQRTAPPREFSELEQAVGARPKAKPDGEKSAAPPPPAEAEEAGTPKQFGQYLLFEKIALGGMAEVWKARMRGVEGFQKTVAIKKILPHLTDSDDFSTMFVDEAKLAAQLSHNNIIHIYDLGKIGDDYFIAMEYVDGHDLREILQTARKRGETMPLGLALLVGARLASALDYAHRKRDFENRELGLVHRDVSPQNVLISHEGDIKLCDFGVAKAVSKATKTQMGALKGKLQYMSPEQAWGESVDARTDIFSLGVLLFEMLTGERLFAGSSEISVLEAVRECRVRPLREINPKIPPETEQVVLTALAKDPAERYQSARELQDALEDGLQQLRPTPGLTELAEWMHSIFGESAPTAAAVEEEPAEAAPAEAPAAEEPAAEEPAAAEPPAEEPVSEEPEPAPPPSEEKRPQAVPVAAPLPGKEPEGESRVRLWAYLGAAAAVVLAAVLIWGLAGNDEGAAPPASGDQATVAESSTPPPNAAEPQSPAETEPGSAEAAPEEEPPAQQAGPAQQQRQRPSAAAPATTTATTPPATPEPDPEAERLTEMQQRFQEELARRERELKRRLQSDFEQEQEQLLRQIEEAQQQAQSAAAAEEGAPVQPGQLVEPGPGVTPPQMQGSLQPQLPADLSALPEDAAVDLAVLVDENGEVADIRLLRGVAPELGVNEAVLAAAREAQFTPATKEGVRVKMWYNLSVPVR